MLDGYMKFIWEKGARAIADLDRPEFRNMPLDKLQPFKNHPFRVPDDDSMQQMVDSIKQYGVIVPLIVRPVQDGNYEVISGHHRLHAAEKAGSETVPVLIRNLDDDEATIMMVDSNLQRENLLPSEKARAYRMKQDAVKHQGAHRESTSGQLGRKLEISSSDIGKQTGDSDRQVRRYIRLTYLIPELMEMVDEKKIAFNPAVELSYLKKDEQEEFLEAMNYGQTAPSLCPKDQKTQPAGQVHTGCHE